MFAPPKPKVPSSQPATPAQRPATPTQKPPPVPKPSPTVQEVVPQVAKVTNPTQSKAALPPPEVSVLCRVCDFLSVAFLLPPMILRSKSLFLILQVTNGNVENSDHVAEVQRLSSECERLVCLRESD